ncbi:MAG: hypothetical protein HUU46_05655 [Candidatus Hydrogenedentes bacterium]|nr:hypothetical protein [Candidatus Hydrogenedentota bacterium]
MSDLVLPLIMRWAHILAAIVAVGGAVFVRFVLMPSAQQTLDDKTRAELRAAVTRRWMKFIHTCILLFLISGFYNYLVIQAPAHKGQSIYHMLFGIKFLLALVVFALAIALASLKPWSEKLRANAKLWQGLLVALAVVIVLISGYMRSIPRV